MAEITKAFQNSSRKKTAEACPKQGSRIRGVEGARGFKAKISLSQRPQRPQSKSFFAGRERPRPTKSSAYLGGKDNDEFFALAVLSARAKDLSLSDLCELERSGREIVTFC
jgi:hypothetical protein